MKLRKIVLAAALTAIGAASLVSLRAPFAQAKEQYLPVLSYRTGPYAPNGTPTANGIVDYYKLVNARGGINGVKLLFEECETGYDTARSVECYERLKGKNGGATLIHPWSTGATFALTEKAPADKIPLITTGLRPQRKRRRHHLQMELPAAGHLLGRRRRHHPGHRQEGRRPGQAQGQEDRAGLPRQPVRQGTHSAAAGAQPRCTAFTNCSCCR
jgi:branched-chain amino acid transport system substrate-binding protein